MLIVDDIKANEFMNLLNKTTDYNMHHILHYIKTSGNIRSKLNILLLKRYHEERDKGVPLECIMARTVLILANEGLVNYTINRCINSEYSDDLYSIGKMGLIKAIDAYREGGNFGSLALTLIHNEIMLHFRKQKSKVEQKALIQSLEAPILLDQYFYDKDKTIDLQDVLADDNDFREEVMHKDLGRYITTLFKYLQPIEQKVVIFSVGLFGCPALNQRDIAKVLGATQPSVSKILTRAVRKIRILLLEDGTTVDDDNYKKIIKREYAVVSIDELNSIQGVLY